MTEFYDTHAHLDYPEFQADLADVIQRAHQAGVSRIISIGTDLESSRRAVDLAERHPGVFAVVGWHPSGALDAPEDIRGNLRRMAVHPRVVALGETGLDYYRLPSSRGGSAGDDDHYRRRQSELFQQHLEVASETGLNCVVHQRAALQDVLAQLRPWSDRVRGQFHCFAESAGVLVEILRMGSIVSFTGIATFKSAGNVREAIRAAPLGSFMLETDCPFLAPVPDRGKRCEPAHVLEVARTAAGVKECTLEELSRATCDTARGFFSRMD